MLAEIGDDRPRFTDARALKAYAGSAPITRASGKSVSITYRRIKNDRLAAGAYRTFSGDSWVVPREDDDIYLSVEGVQRLDGSIDKYIVLPGGHAHGCGHPATR